MNKPLICMSAILFMTTAGSVFAYNQSPADKELLKTANARIEQIRKSNAVILMNYKDDSPAKNIKVEVKQITHAFKFGCNIFPLFDYKGEQHEKYASEFKAVFNYATLPFYWSSYEYESGKKKTDDIKRIAEWCKANNIITKGHPLVWHEAYPKWAPSDPDETKEKLAARVNEIVSGFKGLIDIWDVVNEATVSNQFNNGIGNWAKRNGAADMVNESLQWAKAANKRSTLLYNDFNVGPEYDKLLGELLSKNAPFDAIGIQSHMHGGEWSIEKVWDTCQRYSIYGKPIHFTELTVLSGENGWMKPAPWPTTAQGELKQAKYVTDLYKLLFSHPAVEAITWWDMMDGSWQGAPAGLVRADLSPKPSYKRLKSLVNSTWRTKTEGVSDADGLFRFRGFMGRYQVTISTPKGSKTAEFDLIPGSNVWNMVLSGPEIK